MSDISTYLEAIKERFDLSSDYTLAKKLGIAQPEANLMRRGLKIPRPVEKSFPNAGHAIKWVRTLRTQLARY